MSNYHSLNNTFINERLKQKLDEIGKYSITTVIAPMGYGKTTALNWWIKGQLRNHSDIVILRQAIITDSVQDFWSGFCRAFKDYPELVEQLKALGYPKDTISISVLADILNDALSSNAKGIYFLLDDLYILKQKTFIQILALLAYRLQDYVHIVLLSRNQIFNEEEKMRLGNRLLEIEIEDLRLELQELDIYAKKCKLQIPMKDLESLAIQSEGWISMVYLNFKFYVQKRYWLSNSSDIYSLIDQVLLDPLSERQREFLILIGITDEFTLKQAEYIWQEDDVPYLLNTLSKNNAFITKNENGNYRYHHMLQQCTRQKFNEKSDDYQKKNYSRLGKWHYNEGEYIAAYYAFAKAQDWEGLLTTFEKDKAKSLNTEHSQDFFQWIKDCPEKILLKHPLVTVVCMVKMFSFHNISEIMKMKTLLLKSLEQNTILTLKERNNLLGDAELSESFLRYNDISAMSAYHRRACSLLTRTSLSVDPKGAWTFSAPSILMMYHRSVGGADKENEEMKECMPYYYQVSDGHGKGAEHGFQADLFYERGQIIDADIYNRMTNSSAKERNQYSIMICSCFLAMRMAIFNGDLNRMKILSFECREWLHKERQYTLLNTLDMCQGFLYAVLGYPEEAPKWLAEGRLSEALVMFPATPMLHTFYNQLLLAQGEYTQVIARQEECKKIYGIYNNVLCEIWLHIQLGSAFYQISRHEQALNEIIIALEMATPDSIVMPFVESERYILELLGELQKTGIYVEEIEKILSLSYEFRGKRKKMYLENCGIYNAHGLSDRELEIARLAAMRKTNLEIGQELHIAEGTVRNQLSRIFDKLGIVGNGKNKRIALENFIKMEK